jgi:hypothetical protein
MSREPQSPSSVPQSPNDLASKYETPFHEEACPPLVPSMLGYHNGVGEHPHEKHNHHRSSHPNSGLTHTVSGNGTNSLIVDTHPHGAVTKHAPYDPYRQLLPMLIRPTRLRRGQKSREWIPDSVRSCRRRTFGDRDIRRNRLISMRCRSLNPPQKLAPEWLVRAISVSL